jgi:hypothetical protein
MAFLYGELEKAKKDIMIGLGNADRSGTLYKEIMDIIDKKKKDRLDSPLHRAAYLLNPYYSYNDDSVSQVCLPWMGSWRLLKLFFMVTMISRAKFSMKSWTSLKTTTATSGNLQH